MQYTDDILSNVQSILSTGLQSFDESTNKLMSDLNDSYNVVVQSRKELSGQDEEETYTDTYEDTEDVTVDLED